MEGSYFGRAVEQRETERGKIFLFAEMPSPSSTVPPDVYIANSLDNVVI